MGRKVGKHGLEGCGGRGSQTLLGPTTAAAPAHGHQEAERAVVQIEVGGHNATNVVLSQSYPFVALKLS